VANSSLPTSGLGSTVSGQSKIAAIIPAHNSAATIARALDSVLAQNRPADEIIVIDDHSSDDTCGIVARYAGSGVRLMALSARVGAGEARNKGVAEATSELVAFLDSDDEWLGEKLDKQVALITSDPAISFVASGVTFVSPVGTDLGDLFRCAGVVTGVEAWKALLACNFIATSSVMTWRRNFLAVGGFDPLLKTGEDQDLFIRLALIGSLEFVHEKLAQQHEREISLSTWNLGDLLTYTLPMIERHLAALRSRLSNTEIRQIRGERLSRLGRVAYARGNLSQGISLLGRSLLMGYRPLENLSYLTAGSPPALRLKRLLRLASRARS
jgi:glycosyltransferase involved in cell wall biosynthesis